MTVIEIILKKLTVARHIFCRTLLSNFVKIRHHLLAFDNCSKINLHCPYFGFISVVTVQKH